MSAPRPRWLRLWLAPATASAALRVALVVGTGLNLINHGEAIWHGADPDWLRLLLNYLVPYAVASYGAVSNELRREAADGR